MITQADIDAFELPHWAISKAKGDHTLPNAALPTRDGRRTGNAVMVGLSERQWEGKPVTYKVITDAGNILHVNENELKELFYPPEWCMEKLLPAHIKALRDEEQDHA